MSTEENNLLNRRFVEEVFTNGNLALDHERCAASEHEALERKIFRLALTITKEPSKLGQVRQMLVHLQEQRGLPEDFYSWAIGQIDARVMSMALEYAHDAEVIVQILSFKDGTFDRLKQAIEDMYRLEKISPRVYVKAKLLLRTNEPPQQA
jgi:hypothetical protein